MSDCVDMTSDFVLATAVSSEVSFLPSAVAYHVLRFYFLIFYLLLFSILGDAIQMHLFGSVRSVVPSSASSVCSANKILSALPLIQS
jgi:hypothetical protein